jgi:phage terminase large subunit-like protein
VTRAEDADDPDFTSIGIWGMGSDGAVYFLDGWHGKVDAGDWTETAIDFFENRKPLAHIAGGGPIRRGTEHYLKLRMRQRRASRVLVWYPETHGKEENARDFQGMMQNGMVHWPRGNEEAEWVIRHLIGFGTLRYDDPVDMCAMFGRHCYRLWEAQKPKQIEGAPVFEAGEMPITALMPKGMMKQIKRRAG